MSDGLCCWPAWPLLIRAGPSVASLILYHSQDASQWFLLSNYAHFNESGCYTFTCSRGRRKLDIFSTWYIPKKVKLLHESKKLGSSKAKEELRGVPGSHAPPLTQLYSVQRGPGAGPHRVRGSSQILNLHLSCLFDPPRPPPWSQPAHLNILKVTTLIREMREHWL